MFTRVLQSPLHGKTIIAPAVPPVMQPMGHVFTSPSAVEVTNAQAGDTQLQNRTLVPPTVSAQVASAVPSSFGGDDQPDYTAKAVLAKFHKTAQFNQLPPKDDTLVILKVPYQYGTTAHQ